MGKSKTRSKRRPRSPLVHRQDQRDILLEHYYAVLNQDKRFRSELRELFERAVARGGWDGQPPTDSERQLERYFRELAPPSPLLAFQSFHESAPLPESPPTETVDEFERFAQKWALPERTWVRPKHEGVADLWQSVRLWEGAGRRPARPTLITGPSIDLIPENPEVVIRFDPTLEPLEKAQAELLEARQKAERLGWSPIPAYHRDSSDLRRLALRLYRRAVLHWSFTKIAVEEARKYGTAITAGPASKTVRDWAKRLGIPLPQLTRGRPRRK